jgi:hypothetical protein
MGGYRAAHLTKPGFMRVSGGFTPIMVGPTIRPGAKEAGHQPRTACDELRLDAPDSLPLPQSPSRNRSGRDRVPGGLSGPF